MAEVAVGCAKASNSAKKAEAQKVRVLEVAEAVKCADVVMMLTPDELMPTSTATMCTPISSKGAALRSRMGSTSISA